MSDKLYPGCKVIITTGNGSIFTGVLHSFDDSLGKIVLKKVSTSGSRLCGLQNFYYSDMTKLQIIKETPRSSTKESALPNNNEWNNFVSVPPLISIQHPEMSTPHPEVSTPHPEVSTPPLLMSFPHPETSTPHPPDMSIIHPEKSTPHPEMSIPPPLTSIPPPLTSIPPPLMSIPRPEMFLPDGHPMEGETINADESNMTNTNGTENGENGYVHNGESELLGGNHDNSLLNVNDEYYEHDYYTLIYRLGDKFYEAIDYIMRQKAVGVTFEGVNIGRNGILSVVQISTETDIIAFDMLELGKKAFVEGLQAFFESSKIVKVIHDCRWISDMMQEQFKIRMANIFDTQVANVCVHRILHCGHWPRYVESLPTCLVKHLKLQPEDVAFCKAKDGLQEKPAPSAWLQRPLSKKLLSAAQRNVTYLTQLHQVLLNKMLYDFWMGVEIYMSHVRNMDGDIESCQKQGYLLPPIFSKIPKLVNLTYGDSKDQKGHKSDIQGKDLPAPKRIFLSHNSVRPKPKEPAACARDSEPQDKNAVKYDKEGNAYIVLNRSTIDFWRLHDTGTSMTSNFFENHTVENGSMKLHGEALKNQSLDPQEDIGCGKVQNLSLPSASQISDVQSKTESQEVGDTQVQEFSGSDCFFSGSINKNGEKNNDSKHEKAQFNVLSQTKSNAELGECHKNENSLAFSDIACQSIKHNTSLQEQDQLKASSNQCQSTYKNTLSGEHKDIVLPIENTSMTSEQPSADANFGIRRSKLWQMFCSNEIKEVTELSNHTADLDSHLHKQDLLAVTVPDKDRRVIPKLVRVQHDMESGSQNDPDCRKAIPKLVRVQHDMESDSQNDPDCRKIIPKLIRDNHETESVNRNNTDCRKAIPKLIRDHHDTESVSGNGPDCRRAMPKLARVHTESASRKSPSESSDCDNTPGRSYSVDRLRTSRLSASFYNQSPSSDSESSLAHQLSAELNISKGKDLDCSSFLPAGFDATRAKKKMVTGQSQSHKSDSEYESSNAGFLSLSLEEDLCYIPMQGSLKCRQELPLGVTSFDFGDHSSDSESNIQPGENARCCGDACQVSQADGISKDESLCQFQKSEVFQKVLKMASSLPFENLKSKLLPSKVSLYSK